MVTSPQKKLQVVTLKEAGHSWSESLRLSGVEASESSVYRWVSEWKTEEWSGLVDKRKGKAHKMTVEVKEWLKEYCTANPSVKSGEIRRELKARYGIEVGRTHVNRVRQELGVSRKKK